jgi:hypothetical protein
MMTFCREMVQAPNLSGGQGDSGILDMQAIAVD